jgi:hypothetical protein
MLNEAGKGRIVVVRDPNNKDILLFQVESDSLRSGVKQEKSPDQQDGWDRLDNEAKLAKLLKWTKSGNDRKTR